MLVDPKEGCIKHVTSKHVKKVLNQTADLFKRKIAGDEPTEAEWNEAYRDAIAAIDARAAIAAIDARARSARYKKMADKLIQLLKAAS